MADTAPRILLSNDDSIHADGFGVLEHIARSMTEDVWVCAPETEQSGAGHSLTIHRPLRLRQASERRFAVDGTPTDCVLLAVNHILADHKPDFVLSGVNHGHNIAEDVTYSGTIAAAMESTLLGIRAIAFSQAIPIDGPPDWSTAERWGPEVLRRATAIDWPRGVLINVNFPAIPADKVEGIAIVQHGNNKIGDELVERKDPRGRSYFWIGTTRGGEDVPEDTDIHALLNNRISVTPLYMDLTYRPLIDDLKRAFA